MCRLAAYLGPALAISRIVVDPSHSLLEQSQHANEAKIAVQGDGFGFAWYDGDQGPGQYRDILPAWSDGNLLSLCSMIRAPLFLAHVRASTSGETSRVNCHPFVHGKWSFMHNGQVPDIAEIRRPLEALLPDDLYAARRGSTDSELIFLLMLAKGLDEDPVEAARVVVEILQTFSVYGSGAKNAVRLTCVMSNGSEIFAFRHASDGRAPSLYRQTSQDSGIILASEPLDDTLGDWAPVPQNVVLKVSDNGVNATPFEVTDEQMTDAELVI
ncbi:class II glutamine amidotransferase [Algirhabdus cladophorae]|uniref:class II glutamine amidotransferase n=1 Tax=Algirhabdus cladophorae TaxID=3377108 RepID=UPI003B84633E